MLRPVILQLITPTTTQTRQPEDLIPIPIPRQADLAALLPRFPKVGRHPAAQIQHLRAEVRPQLVEVPVLTLLLR